MPITLKKSLPPLSFADEVGGEGIDNIIFVAKST
jgi:hypothetical protein